MWRVRLVLVLLLVALVLAIRFLPGWAWLVIAGIVVLLPMVLRLIVRWKVRSFVNELGTETPSGMPPLFAALFKMKGSVLRKVRVVVHSVRPTEAPPPPPPDIAPESEMQGLLPPPEEPEPDREGGEGRLMEAAAVVPPRDYYLAEVTIKPTRWGVGFKRWQPGELVLTTPESGWLDNDDACHVAGVEVEQGGVFGPEDEMRYAGPQRLRLLLGVRRGVKRLTFRYYTEKFGEIALPEAGPLSST